MRVASSRPIARPRPKPLRPPVALPRWKRSKISLRSPSGTPGPRSRTASCAHGGCAPASISMSDPCGATRRALSRRMRTIRATAPGSPWAQDGCEGRWARTVTCRRAAPSSNSAATARHSSPSSSGSLRSATSASRRLRSSRSEARWESLRDCSLACAVRWRASWRSTRSALRSSSSSSSVPSREASGVRSSCEAVATNARRAASWRRRRDLHAGERPRELADLVVAGVRRQRAHPAHGARARGWRRAAAPGGAAAWW